VIKWAIHLRQAARVSLFYDFHHRQSAVPVAESIATASAIA
jgi:hypothetical protein